MKIYLVDKPVHGSGTTPCLSTADASFQKLLVNNQPWITHQSSNLYCQFPFVFNTQNTLINTKAVALLLLLSLFKELKP